MGTVKVVIGVILIIISFAYIIKNPSQSMMEGLMKKNRVKQQNFEEDETAEEAVSKNTDSSQE